MIAHFDTFFLHFAADSQGIRNAAVEVSELPRIRCSRNFAKCFAFFFRVYIAEFEFIAHLRVDHTQAYHVSKQELFISNELGWHG